MRTHLKSKVDTQCHPSDKWPSQAAILPKKPNHKSKNTMEHAIIYFNTTAEYNGDKTFFVMEHISSDSGLSILLDYIGAAISENCRTWHDELEFNHVELYTSEDEYLKDWNNDLKRDDHMTIGQF